MVTVALGNVCTSGVAVNEVFMLLYLGTVTLCVVGKLSQLTRFVVTSVIARFCSTALLGTSYSKLAPTDIELNKGWPFTVIVQEYSSRPFCVASKLKRIRSQS